MSQIQRIQYLLKFAEALNGAEGTINYQFKWYKDGSIKLQKQGIRPRYGL